MQIEFIDINKIISNEENPRNIKNKKFDKLCESIKNFPEMLEIRPIVVNANMKILGGNMRYRASKIVGLKKVPIIKAENLTEKQEKEFIIKDNVNAGQWDWDVLGNEWDSLKLEDWGLDSWQNIDDIEASDNFLGNEDESPLQKITFKLAKEQAKKIKEKLKQIKKLEKFKDVETFGNENTDGNALFFLINQ